MLSEQYFVKNSNIINGAAAHIAPIENIIDTDCQDTDDYRQNFCLKLLSVATHNTNPNPTKAWTYVVVRNQLSNFCRDLGRNIFVDSKDNREKLTYDYGRVVEQRDLLCRVKKQLSSSEWKLLTLYCDCDCSVASAWKLHGKKITYRGFFKRITNLRRRVIRIIKKTKN